MRKSSSNDPQVLAARYFAPDPQPNLWLARVSVEQVGCQVCDVISYDE